MREPRRRPRFPLKGGEEKSPYNANFNTVGAALLDGESTIALLFLYNLETQSFFHKRFFRQPVYAHKTKPCKGVVR